MTLSGYLKVLYKIYTLVVNVKIQSHVPYLALVFH